MPAATGDKQIPATPARAPAQHFTPLLITFIIISLTLSALVIWHGWDRYNSFREHRLELAEQALAGAESEINAYLGEVRHYLTVFTSQQTTLIQNLIDNPDDDRLYAELMQRIRVYFPDAYTFVLSDTLGEPDILDLENPVGPVCLSDLEDYVKSSLQNRIRIHPNPLSYHFDMMTPWTDRQGGTRTLLITYPPTVLARILGSHEFGHLKLYLVNADNEGEIEISSVGSRDRFPYDTFLTDEDYRYSVSGAVLPDTRWYLVASLDPRLLADTRGGIVINTLVAIAIIMSAGLAGLLIVSRQIDRRVRAEAAVGLSEMRFMRVAEASPVAIFYTDNTGAFRFVNESWISLTGLTSAAALDDGWLSAVYPDDREDLQKRWTRAIEQTGNLNTFCRVQRPDKTLSWVSFQAVPELDEAGQLAGYVGSAIDVTAFHQTELALPVLASPPAKGSYDDYFRTRLSQLAAVFSIRFSCICLLQDPDQPTRQLIHFWQEDNYIDVSEDALAGTPFANLSSFKPLLIESGARQRYSDSTLFRQLDIESFFAVPVTDTDNRVQGIIAILDDRPLNPEQLASPILHMFARRIALELQRRQQDALLQSQQNILELIAQRSDSQHIGTSICELLDTQSPGAMSMLMYVNSHGDALQMLSAPHLSDELRAAATELPLNPQRATAWTVAAQQRQAIYISDVADDPLWQNYREQAMGSGIRACWSVPVISEHDQLLGTLTIHRRDSGTPSSYDQELLQIGAQLAALAAERDRSEQELTAYRKNLENLVAERTTELEQTVAELESFSYSVSHDLRSPLRAINGFSQLIEEEYANSIDDQGRDYLQRIRSASLHMGHLIDDLLDLARINRQSMDLQPVSISALAETHAELLRAANPGRNLCFDIEPGLHTCADATLLDTVINNLLGNAVKYSLHTESAKIEVGAQQSQGQPVYFVRDNGSGFEMQYADKLFKPFHRLHTGPEYEGTGIGLATVSRAIHRMGGKIWAESVPGEGSTFYFTLAQTAAGKTTS